MLLIFKIFTLSECTLIDPTFVAPTAVIEKNPCSQSPTYTALSFSTNRSGNSRAILGLTLNNSPTKILIIINTSHNIENLL